MRYALTALLALVIGSQADAQLIRRYTPAYTPGYQSYYNTSPGYYSTPGTVVTSGYYSPYLSNSYVSPSSYYAPSAGLGYSNYGGFSNGYSNSGYSNFGYSNYGYRNYGYSGYSNYNRGVGRRGRW